MEKNHTKIRFAYVVNLQTRSSILYVVATHCTNKVTDNVEHKEFSSVLASKLPEKRFPTCRPRVFSGISDAEFGRERF